jgi:hypothetical protein
MTFCDIIDNFFLFALILLVVLAMLQAVLALLL